MRAVAVLMVVAYHAGLPFPDGYVGVDVFFVISGFVITAMLQREWATHGRIRFGQFYLRRFKRLTPALALMLTVTAALSVILLSPFGQQQTVAKTGIGAVFLVANIVIARTTGGYFDGPAETNPLLHTWSLSVEEQFYLFFPALLAGAWLMARRAQRRSALVPYVAVGLVGSLSFVLAIADSVGMGVPGLPDSLGGFYGPLTRAWEFAAGALLALVASRFRFLSGKAGLAFGTTGVAAMAASLWLISESTPFPGLWTLLPVVAAVLLLVAGFTDNAITRGLATATMARVGDWSYSIYLWHWPFIVFTRLTWPEAPRAALVIAAAASLLPAIASYHLVEQPFRQLPAPASSWRLAGTVSAVVAAPVMVAGALWFGSQSAWGMSWPTDAGGQDSHVAMQRGCVDRPFDPIACRWEAAGSSERLVLLVGDSQAYAVADGVVAAADRLSMDTVVSSRSGCPFADVDTSGEKPLDCRSWQDETLSFALDERPEVVVIANRSTGYTRPDLGWRTVLAASGEPAKETATATLLYERGLASFVNELRSAGIGVVVIQNIPEPMSSLPSVSILRKWLSDETANVFDSSDSLAERANASDAEHRVAAQNPGTVLFDPAHELCLSTTCPLIVDKTAVYLDSFHLTRFGSLLLVPSLEGDFIHAASSESS